MKDYKLEAQAMPETELRKKYAELSEAYDKMSDDLLFLEWQVRSLKDELSALLANSKNPKGEKCKDNR